MTGGLILLCAAGAVSLVGVWAIRRAIHQLDNERPAL